MKKIFILAVLVVFMGSLAFAEVFTHQEGGLSIQFPDSWKIKADEDILEADAPDEDAYVQLLVLKDIDTMEEAVNAYAETLDSMIKDFETVDEGDNIDINGLTVFYVDGRGTIEGTTMNVSIALVVTKKAVVMLVILCDPESAEKYKKHFKMMINSLQPA